MSPKSRLTQYSNAGGGGERVLWAAIAATQRRWPNAVCAVYTGDHELERSGVVRKVKNQFGISIDGNKLQLVYLSQRHLVLASTWPHFTLLGQSLGSVILAYDALHLLVPDVFIDTMGYAFAVAFCKYLFPRMPTGAYVHYPTISTDMLESLKDTTGTKGMHSGAGAGWRGRAKQIYWELFARLYGWVGRHIDVVMCNSTWTMGHISQLWNRKGISPTQSTPSTTSTTPTRTLSSSSSPQPFRVLYPPCPVEELHSKIAVNASTEKNRHPMILYIAQFRLEKNHSLILRSFAQYYHRPSAPKTTRLVLIGSVRSNTPDEKHVYNLRLEARELKIQDSVKFICDAPLSVIQEYLPKASISVNGMYSEHFGIGNVEGIAAGLIPVVHNSGGPKLDIVVPLRGERIGFLASTVQEFADAFESVFKLEEKERVSMRLRGRESSLRFTERAFAEGWVEEVGVLIRMQREAAGKSKR